MNCNAFFEVLKEAGVGFFAGVPDSLLKDFCAYVTDNTTEREHIITANEGSAISLAAGNYLGNGGVGLVYMQNSGLGNTVNPLTSLTDNEVYGIPMLLMVGWRGEPGVKDEPQHVKMGEVTLQTLAAIDIHTEVLPDNLEEAAACVRKAVAKTLAEKQPVALVVRKGTFEKYSLQSKRPEPFQMTREEAIGHFVASLPKNPLIVSTTGKPSRELFELREQRGEDHDGDFLTVGCMGHSSQIALGVALANPDRSVYCLDGDGAVLMHMGGLATIASLAPSNYRHVVLNNGAHDSVGGQPTVGFSIDIPAIAKACGYRHAESVDGEHAIADALERLNAASGPALLEIKVCTGARADLGRPTMTPRELKERFMAFAEKS
ncbi:MAG: phosphonopyruvate decarboxylase [Myxococcales bacterium]|nr:phosphonopyruvate decarboxylase [Myxococcales bacterium]